MRMRMAVAASMCLWISVAISLLWSSSCPIPRVSANPGVSRMRTLGRNYTYSLSQHVGTYHYAVVASDFVKAGRVGLSLAAGTTLLVVVVEDFKAVAINSVSDKDIGKEFQE